MKNVSPTEQQSPRAYTKPQVKFVKLEPEERLLACTKLKGICPAMQDKAS